MRFAGPRLRAVPHDAWVALPDQMHCLWTPVFVGHSPIRKRQLAAEGAALFRPTLAERSMGRVAQGALHNDSANLVSSNPRWLGRRRR